MDELQLRNREVFLAGREVSKYWTTYFFQQKWEEDPNRTYPAMLLGWIRQVHTQLQKIPNTISNSLMSCNRQEFETSRFGGRGTV